jgi:hypothetical protein
MKLKKNKYKLKKQKQIKNIKTNNFFLRWCTINKNTIFLIYTTSCGAKKVYFQRVK